jgi:hypothetical protein
MRWLLSPTHSGKVAQFAQRDRQHCEVSTLAFGQFAQHATSTIEGMGLLALPWLQPAGLQGIGGQLPLQAGEIIARGGLGQRLPVAIRRQRRDLRTQARKSQ